MKPLKTRIKIYALIAAFGLIANLGLLMTGYDYRKSQGFFVSQDRESMSFSEALIRLPNEYIWWLLFFVLIVLVVEVVVFAFMLFRK